MSFAAGEEGLELRDLGRDAAPPPDVVLDSAVEADIRVVGAKLVDAFKTVAQETDRLAQLLKTGHSIPAGQYGAAPPPQNEYGRVVIDQYGETSLVGQEAADAQDAGVANPPPGASADVRNANEVVRQCVEVQAKARDLLNTRANRLSLDDAKKLRDDARTAVEDAEKAAKRLDKNSQAGKTARDAAAKARKLFDAMNVRVKLSSALYRTFHDSQGNFKTGTKVGLAAGVTLAISTIGGVLIWYFAFRPNASVAQTGFAALAASQMWPDGDFDVLSISGIDPSTVTSVQLIPPGTTGRMASVTDSNGIWNALSNNHITYTLTTPTQPSAPIQIQYVIERSNIESSPAFLTLIFLPAGKASNITTGAPDRTSAVPITIPNGSTLLNTDPGSSTTITVKDPGGNTIGTWTLTPPTATVAMTQVIFKPGSRPVSTTIEQVSCTYQVPGGTASTNQGTLVVIFPIIDFVFTVDMNGKIQSPNLLPLDATLVDAAGSPISTWTDRLYGSVALSSTSNGLNKQATYTLPAGGVPQNSSKALTSVPYQVVVNQNQSVAAGRSINTAHLILLFPANDLWFAAPDDYATLYTDGLVLGSFSKAVPVGALLTAPSVTRVAETGGTTVTDTYATWAIDPMAMGNPAQLTFTAIAKPPSMLGPAVPGQLLSTPYNVSVEGVPSTNVNATVNVLFPPSQIAISFPDPTKQITVASGLAPNIKLLDNNGTETTNWTDPGRGTWDLSNGNLTFQPVTGGVPTTVPIVGTQLVQVLQGVPSAAASASVLYPDSAVSGSRLVASPTLIPVPKGTILLDSKTNQQTTVFNDTPNNATWTVQGELVTFQPLRGGVPATSPYTLVYYIVTDAYGVQLAQSKLTINFS
jgi:hypothetical protein